MNKQTILSITLLLSFPIKGMHIKPSNADSFRFPVEIRWKAASPSGAKKALTTLISQESTETNIKEFDELINVAWSLSPQRGVKKEDIDEIVKLIARADARIQELAQAKHDAPHIDWRHTVKGAAILGAIGLGSYGISKTPAVQHYLLHFFSCTCTAKQKLYQGGILATFASIAGWGVKRGWTHMYNGLGYHEYLAAQEARCIALKALADNRKRTIENMLQPIPLPVAPALIFPSVSPYASSISQANPLPLSASFSHQMQTSSESTRRHDDQQANVASAYERPPLYQSPSRQ